MCWKEWKKSYYCFYDETQKNGIGNVVNSAGYAVLKSINLNGLRVLEIGPGSLSHIRHWNGRPERYVLIDIDEKFLKTASKKLSELKIPNEKRLINRKTGSCLPAEDGEFDLILSFYSFEHLHPFRFYFQELIRTLKKKGRIAGAIPAEGGLAWGGGRYLTSRRWFKKNTKIDPDKIICWEHPTMADEILATLGEHMKTEIIEFWPLVVPSIDLNLVIKFIFKK